MVFVLDLLSALFAVLAAGAWTYSSMVKGYPTANPGPKPAGPSYPTPQLGMGRDRKGHQYELFATLRLQSKWSGYAALLAAAAALFQAAVVMAPFFLNPREGALPRVKFVPKVLNFEGQPNPSYSSHLPDPRLTRH